MGIFQAFTVIITIILLGVMFQRTKLLSAEQIDGFGVFLIKLAMPCYLFISTLRQDLSSLFYFDYILSFLITFIIIISIVAILYYKHTHPLALCIKMLTAGYPNAVIYTLPVITFLLKDPTSGIIGNILQIVIIQSIFLMVMSFIRHKEHSLLKKIFMLVTTPFILAPILGIVCNFAHYNPPAVILQITEHIGNGATSIALFTFGLSIGEVQFNRKTFSKSIVSLIAIKNFLHPAVAFVIGKYIFALDQYWLYSLIISSSAPTAFVVQLLSKQFKVEELLVKRTVAFSSIFSLLSLALITLLLL